MSEYFPKPKSFSKHVTKADLKNSVGADTLDFVKKADLVNSKSDVDKLDIDKLKNMPSYLSSLNTKVDKLDIGKLQTAPAD